MNQNYVKQNRQIALKRRRKKHGAATVQLLLSTISLAMMTTGGALAQNTTWTNPGSGNWHTAGNWNNGVPNSSLSALINNGGTAEIANNASAQLQVLSIGSMSGASGNVILQAGSIMSVANVALIGNTTGMASKLEINGGLLDHTGNSFWIRASGTLILRNGGTIDVSANGNGGTLGLNGGTLVIGDGGGSVITTANGIISSTPSSRVVFDNQGNSSFSTKIRNNITVMHNGSGITTLSGDNNYDATHLNAGVLSVSSNGNLGNANGGLNFNGGTLRSTASIFMNRATSIDTNGGTFDIGVGITLTHAGVISGDGTLTKAGSGTLTLSGDSSDFDGTTQLKAGTLVLTGALGGSIEAEGNSVFNAAAANAIGGFNMHTFHDSSTLNAQAADAISGGRQEFWDSTSLNATVTDAIVGGMQIFNDDSILNASALRAIADSSQEFNDDSALNATAAGAIANGWQDFYGNSTLNATAANAITGGQQSFEATTRLNASAGSIAGGQQTFWEGSILNATGTEAVKSGQQIFQDTSKLNVLATNALAATTDIRFRKLGSSSSSGTLSLNGFSTTIGSINSLNNGAGRITNDGATNSVLSVDSSANSSTFLGIIQNGSGSGKLGLTLTGGTLTLSNKLNSYTGGTVVSGGTLRATASGAFVSDTDYVVNGGTLDLGNFSLDMSSLSGTGGEVALGTATLTIEQSTNTTFAGRFSGSGYVMKSRTGTLTLTGNSSAFTGETNVLAGTLRVDGTLGGDLYLRPAGTVTGSGVIGGVVSVTGTGTLAGTQGQTLTTGGLTLASGANVNVALGATGGASLFQINGDLTLDGTLNVTNAGGFGVGVYRIMTYTGTLTDNGLDIGAMPGLPTGAATAVQTATANQVNLIVNNPVPALQFWNGTTTTADGTIHGGSGTWSAGPATNWTDSNGSAVAAWGSKFAVFQNNPAHVTIDGTVSTTGVQFIGNGWTVSGGTIALNGDNGSTTIRVGDNSDAGANWTTTINSTLTGSGGLLKTDFGTLILAGNNTYMGNTIVQSGKLTVTGSLTGAINVVAGGRLGGNGTVGSIMASGMIAPGNSIGTLTVGNITFNKGSTYEVEVNAAGQSDLIKVHGMATINGGSVQVLAGAGNYAPKTRYTILTAAGGLTGTFTGGVTSNLAFLDPSLSYDAGNAYAEETNRLNRERRSSGDAWKAELVKIEKQIRGIIEAIKAGMFHESMKAEMDTLEARKVELTELLAEAPQDTPDILSSASAIYAKKVSALTTALNRKEERQEAAETLRGLIEKISLTPGPERCEIYATLHGELGTILNWTERQAIGKAAKTTKPAAAATGLFVFGCGGRI